MTNSRVKPCLLEWYILGQRVHFGREDDLQPCQRRIGVRLEAAEAQRHRLGVEGEPVGQWAVADQRGEKAPRLMSNKAMSLS